MCDVKRAMKLVSQDVLLERSREIEALQPLVQGDLAALHDGLVVTVKSLRQGFGPAVNARRLVA
jgi:hypothetical protein